MIFNLIVAEIRRHVKVERTYVANCDVQKKRPQFYLQPQLGGSVAMSSLEV